MKKNKKTKIALRIFGFIFIPLGLIFIIIGISSIFNHNFNNLFYSFIGFPIFILGIWALMFGFMNEMGNYIANENIPILKKYLDNTIHKDERINCPHCNQSIEIDSKFCNNCGKEL